MDASASKGGAKASKIARKGNAKSGNLYDRIAEARARRESVPVKASKVTQPAQKPKTALPQPMPIPVDPSQRPQKKTAANMPAPPPKTLPPIAPAKEEKKKRSAILWIASAIVAALLIGYVALESRVSLEPSPLSRNLNAEVEQNSTFMLSAPKEVPQTPALSSPSEQWFEIATQADQLTPPPMPDPAVSLNSDDTVTTGPAFNPADYRIVMNAPQSVSERALQIAVVGLEQAGFSADRRSINLSISENNVRFYHAADEDVAKIIAGATQSKARDFTAFRPSPPEGLIEIWLSGARVTSSTNTAQANAPDGANALKDLQSLAVQIRRAFGQR